MCMYCGVGECGDADYDADLRSKEQSTILTYGTECRARSRLGPPPIIILEHLYSSKSCKLPYPVTTYAIIILMQGVVLRY